MDRNQAEQIAAKELVSGERLLWSGAPKPGGMAVSAIPVTLMGLVFTAFAAFWIASAVSMSSGSSGDGFPGAIFPLFGLPFLLIGGGMLFAPVWAYRAAQTTVYAVTDQRLMIITAAKTVGVRSFTPEDIGDMARVEGPDGSGTLKFGAVTNLMVRNGAKLSLGAFIGIPEVRRVEQLIRENLLQRAA